MFFQLWRFTWLGDTLGRIFLFFFSFPFVGILLRIMMGYDYSFYFLLSYCVSWKDLCLTAPIARFR
ncbi:hypothetical protein BDW75DRAFT_95791 [Aspergillus navahoensis]